MVEFFASCDKKHWTFKARNFVNKICNLQPNFKHPKNGSEKERKKSTLLKTLTIKKTNLTVSSWNKNVSIPPKRKFQDRFFRCISIPILEQVMRNSGNESENFFLFLREIVSTWQSSFSNIFHPFQDWFALPALWCWDVCNNTLPLVWNKTMPEFEMSVGVGVKYTFVVLLWMSCNKNCMQGNSGCSLTKYCYIFIEIAHFSPDDANWDRNIYDFSLPI